MTASRTSASRTSASRTSASRTSASRTSASRTSGPRTTPTTAGRAVAALTAAAVLGLFAGCGGARNSLGTAASTCFRALPPARDAVSRKGKLVGVRKIGTATLRKRLPADPRLATVTDKNLCVFAFKDTFQPSDVPLSPTKRPGVYAVVAVTIKHPTVVAAVIVDRLPGRFGHLR